MTSLSDPEIIDLQPEDDAEAIVPENALVQTCEVCQSLIDVSDREPLEAVGCPHCGAPLTVHGTLGHLQLIEVSGRGGMGVVYKAYDPSLDRHVAVKLLRKDHSGQTALIAQLENEAAITAAVTDSNVVRVFSTGTDRGRFYIAMELVELGSLDDLIRLQGRIAEVQALQIGIQIAKGLKAALHHGLIHRDVKPGNILFADANTAKIVDFGLAIFMNQEESARGEIWGTPYYVSPEKLDFRPEDCRSDIYSLGASLFHGLAGRPPFEADTASLVALQHLKAQPVSLATYAPWVSGATAFVINRTLHKNPAERYQSYDELIEHLEYALGEVQRATARNQPRARIVLETEEDQQRTTWAVIAMLAVSVLLAGGLFLFRKQIFRHEAPVAQARTQPIPTAPAPSARALATNGFAFASELAQLAAGDPKAGAAFHKAGTHDKLSPENRAWAALLEGAAELNAGHAAPARAAFQQVQSLAGKTGNEKLTTFFIGTAAHLLTDSPLTIGDARDADRTGPGAIALLLFGLKDWQLGRIDDGVALLRQFRSSNPAGVGAWVGELKVLATDRIEEFTAFQMHSDALKAATATAERAQAAAAMRKLGATFAARTEAALAPFAAEFEAYEVMQNQIPADGVYKLINQKTGKCVDVSGGAAGPGLDEDANVHQWDDAGALNQQWQLTKLASGSFQLVAKHSGKALDVENGQTDDGANVRQHTLNDAPAQRWKIASVGEGFFKLIAEGSGKLLTVAGGATENGTNIFQWTDTGGAEQHWRFVPVTASPGG